MQRPQRYKNADALQPFSTFHIDQQSLIRGVLQVMERIKLVKKFMINFSNLASKCCNSLALR